MGNKIVNREILKEKIYLLHWTQQDLADFLHVSRQTVIQKMSGKVDFSEDEMIALKSKFGKSIFFIK